MTTDEQKPKKPKLDVNQHLSSSNKIIDSQPVIIPLSPGLDMITGGIPEGSFFILTGKFKTGKTATALDFAGTAQDIEYACNLGRKEGRHVYYANIEGRLKKRDLEGIHHLNLDPTRFSIIQSTPGNILTAEEYIAIVEQLIHTKPGDIFIIDSFSALCTEGEMKADIGDRYRADAPMLLARFCRRICNVTPINKCVVIGITHVIANQGQGYTQWMEASGQKIQYQADVKLRATHFTPWKVGENQIGQDIHWECPTSALNCPPGGKFTSKFRYGYGIDKETELINVCTDLGILPKGGAGWYTLPSGEKCQGTEKVRAYLLENPEVYNSLYSQLRKILV